MKISFAGAVLAFLVVLLVLPAFGAPLPADPHEYCHGTDNRGTPWKAPVTSFCSYLNALFDVLHDAQQKGIALNGTEITVHRNLDVLNLKDPRDPATLVRALQETGNLTTDTSSFFRTSLAKEAQQVTAQNRSDQQTAAPSNAGGSTSLVSTAGSTDFLALALDAGGLTRTVTGTTATITGNMEGVYRGVTRTVTGTSPLCVFPCDNQKWYDNWFLEPTSFSVVTKLDQSSPTTAPAAGQASGTTSNSFSLVSIPQQAGKLSNVTVRYQIINRFDPNSKDFKNAWNGVLASTASGQPAIISSAIQVSISSEKVADVARRKCDQFKWDIISHDTTREGLAAHFEGYFVEQAQKMRNDPELMDALIQAVKDLGTYYQNWTNVREVAAGNLLTVEYNYNHPIIQPDTHDIKLIFARAFKNSTTDAMFTLNGAASIYGGTPPPAAKYGRLHYGQVSGELDWTMAAANRSPGLLRTSVAGYWQYQPDPSVLNIPAGTVVPGTSIPLSNGTQEFVGTAGSLWVVQAKATLRPKAGMNIPFGVTWSNKTDLLSGNKVGAQVGISYDFSNIFSTNTSQ